MTPCIAIYLNPLTPYLFDGGQGTGHKARNMPLLEDTADSLKIMPALLAQVVIREDNCLGK